MWEFSGEIEYTCDNCKDCGVIPIEDFSVECTGGSEKGMGAEHIYELSYVFECIKCSHDITLSFDVSEYPLEVSNFTIDNSTGATTEGTPEFEHLPEIYSAIDLIGFCSSTPALILALKSCPDLVREIDSREFEEVVTEIFRSKGFEVELTKRTRDGGKDIIAIHTDTLGIKNKYFIECKRHAEDNKVDVGIVRALQGVKNTKDGPNKTILVTTSSFSLDAKKFVENEAASKWDVSLADYNDLVAWINDYQES